MLSRIKNRFLRSLLLPALLFALTFRGAIPVGYMPAAADGALRIVMCSGFVLPDAPDSAPSSATGSAHDGTSPCPFAASALPPVQMAVTFAIVALPPDLFTQPRAQPGLSSVLLRAQQARAPPLSRHTES